MKKLFNKICLAVLSVSILASSFSFAACGHTHTPDTPIRENEVEATCISGGSYDEVTYCSECYEEISRVPKTTEKSGHTPAAPVKENEVPATCSESGSYEEVINCSVCHEEISRTEKTIPTVAHVYAETLSKDKTGHWYNCENCTDKKDFKEHTPGAAATEDSPQICTVCEYVIAPPVGHIHSLTPVSAVAADCTTAGNIPYYTCDCGKWFEDDEAQTEIENHASVVIKASGHKMENDVDEDGNKIIICKKCGEFKIVKNYVFEAEYTKLAGLKGQGYSSEASGDRLVVHDGYGDIGEEGPAKASNGFYVGYFYKYGLTLTFRINSDCEVNNAKLSMRLSGEILETVELTCDEFEVKVNGEKMIYDKVSITGINPDMNVEEKREFQDFLVSANVHLVEGENVITMTVNNGKKMAGAIGCTAPLIDCIKIETTAELTWDPVLKNLNRFE